ncbi:MAG: DUF2934 domain-containing protein [Opitutus sp.]
MNTEKKVSPPSRDLPEDEIRDYAYHLYEQSGCASGHDEENWLEAKACLEANIPRERTHLRLHRHHHPDDADIVEIFAIQTIREPVLVVR